MVSLATTSRKPALPATPTISRSKMLPTSSPVPILKTSKAPPVVAGSKRKMSEMDIPLSPSSSQADDATEALPPTKKRPRVQFDQDVTIHGDISSEKSLAVIREEVRGAIHRHVTMSESEGYDRIKGMFSADPTKEGDDSLLAYESPTHASLRNHLLGLISHVASLDRSCSGLVHAIINSEWLGRDDSYMKLYTRFLGNLAAAQGTFLGPVLKMLATNLGSIPRGRGRLPGYAVVSPSEMHTRVHMAMRHVLRLIPAGSGSLSPILSSQFPFDSDSASANIAYTRNLIQIISYAPELQSDILALITEKLVKVDVEIQVDMEDFEEEVGDEILDEVDDEEEDDDDASVVSDESEDDDSKGAKKIKDNILKVDGMIDLLFEYFSPPFTSGTLDDQENALDLLLSHFQSIILPTYRSRHSQFLLFHFSQASPVLVDRFASTFVQLIFNKLQPGIMRQSAAAYLASFVARGAHISGEVVRDVFDLLLTHLNSLRMDYEDSCRGPDLRRYGPFYSTAQALLYIFCFRWRDLTTAAVDGDTPDQVDELEPGQIAFPPNMKEFLHKCIYSRLNPLKVCSPAIVAEFARIAHHFQFLYVYPLLETNKRIRVTAFRNISNLSDPRFSHVGREIRAGDNIGYQLDAYFPFDPYQLPRSRRWLEGDYVEWRGIPGLDDANESDSGADESDDESGDDATETDEE
ncbi:RNA polymerase I specific transcription initiation factor RRN3 [Penicillium expansum]|uniref:RNA polymerase I specific transcription initiation factor RRN3 n=1 Tax=Penicillium expansum TaxID=27334 RepID=A0A0A2IEL8_PENEN|nr:RNA polymerase I specific transcription initiation factor RRN3 [Penicillium expansum]KAJ5501141.1 RNA polymerase I specific transcription initiation factor RRN3 [Penicillium expansum]KGO41514.1 RNA polymerase I specific transcription initiation factor RRN3 [Penicillium expansum]KGO47490.1 RNA polymerase I specific transcription initiation factor RRN3 [Penicillium expansum]KGO62466.1 RNA polymerase I specific transcription initiation factor RRN3 [Penicillium expansum]